jgi:calcineurin-like phosphoesterase family protein
MKVYIISDTHLNHDQIATYCDRPANFTEVIVRNWKRIVQPTDLVLHVGDVFIGKPSGWKEIFPQLPGRKILIRGNHDRHHGCTWWMENGFDAAMDAMIFRHVYITHKPANFLPSGCEINLHGHLHNIWHGFHHGDPGTEKITKSGRLKNPWQRLFSVEYTDYSPIEFEKFMSHPDKYLARGPEKKAKQIVVDIEASNGPLIYPDPAVDQEAAREFKERTMKSKVIYE